jgi:poly(3-hydroxybutyrate) depolymerase
LDATTALVTFGAGLVGVLLGGLIARRNEKRAQGERLLVEALNDAVTAIAEVAGGEGKRAQNRYASAMSRIALHASPPVLARFREFQEDATTTTYEGRARLIAALQAARTELGHDQAETHDLAVLLFGDDRTASERITAASCNVWRDGHRIERQPLGIDPDALQVRRD